MSVGVALDAELAALRDGLAALAERVVALEVAPPVVVPDPKPEPEAPPSTWQPPLVIRSGGTYEGRWASPDGAPAITVLTDEPVTIRGAARGHGHLVALPWDSVGQRVHLDRLHFDSLGHGRAVHAERIVSLRVTGCGLTDTAGIYVNASEGATVQIDDTEAVNIGRYRTTGDYVQFVQLNNSPNLRGFIRACWVENHPFESNVEDIISLHNSGGTPAAPFIIEDNLLDGAYARDPVSMDFSGGGIMLGDAFGSYAVARRNTILMTSNYGGAISGGVGNRFDDNLVLGLRLLPDGRVIRAANVGAYIWHQGPRASESRDNAGRGNRVGWVKANGQRNDWWMPDAAAWAATAVTPTAAAVQAARDAWHAARKPA